MNKGSEDAKDGHSCRHTKDSKKFERARTSSSSSANSTIPGAPQNEEEHKVAKRKSCASRWEGMTHRFQRPIVSLLQMITSVSAHDPKLTISFCLLMGCCMIMVGFSTNFEVIVEQLTLWTPLGSEPLEHQQWRDNASGFPTEPREALMVFHADGENVLGHEQIRRVFLVLDAIRDVPGYNELCDVDEHSCRIYGVTRFFDHSSETFESLVSNDQEAVAAISARYFPDGTPVNDPDVFGHPIRASNGTLESAQSYFLLIAFPETPQTKTFESALLDVLIDDIRVEWRNEPGNTFRLEAQTPRTFSDEFTRAIESDIPLIPVVFAVMAVFTSWVFWKSDRVQSRTLLGFGAVVGVLLAILTGYGILFAAGIPFTSMTPIVPFVIFGVGLDDAFIIFGSFDRTDRGKSIEERIHDTYEECGLSITLTTLTSVVAFALGCTSSIPAIYWLSLYAFPTVILVLLFQLTFFTSCIVLDERRVLASRRDCCVCISAPPSSKADDIEDTTGESDEYDSDEKEQGKPRLEHVWLSTSERAMSWYARQLLRPSVKVIVLIGFAALFGACAVSASSLKQHFNYVELLPVDSYALGFFRSVEDYSSRVPVVPFAYFRDVDQADEAVQDQMLAYIDDIVAMHEVVTPPAFFWLKDFRKFADRQSVDFLGNLTFIEQLTLFLADPIYHQLYTNDIVRDKNGNVTASRVLISMDNVDLGNVSSQVDTLLEQRHIAESQPINRGRSTMAFFLFTEVFNYWELYSRAVNELIATTLMSIGTVTLLALVLIPHWTAAVIVLPSIVSLYIDLLGVLGWAGVKINPVTYVALVMSIGLMVDYLMHILLRYYECTGNREERIIQSLQSMGWSILVGCITTFLGAMPLAFSSSAIFMTIFYAFMGLVTLGAGHGLILLPVILSIVGPQSDQQEPALPTIAEEDQSLKEMHSRGLRVEP